MSVSGHVSMMLICNANGIALPPLYVVSGVKLLHDILNGAPEGLSCHEKCRQEKCVMFKSCYVMLGSVACHYSSGSFTTNMFIDVVRHIINHTTPGKKLLILDGHNSHHSIEALDLYVMLCHVMKCS
jgi:hypothetical protein